MRTKSTKRFFSLIVALISVYGGELFSQKIKEIPVVLVTENKGVTYKSFQKAVRSDMLRTEGRENVGKIALSDLKKPLQPLAAGYFHDNLAFFCRVENRLEKITQVPLRFRLGSLAYTDYLEQKPNAVKP